MNRIAKSSLLIITLFATLCTTAQSVKEPTNTDPNWSKSYPAFRIAGNLYYVGTYDLASYLIVTPVGNILINTGLAASDKTIKTSIESLGFKLADTKILLTTQAHYDHLGAMSAIQQATGAHMMIDEADAAVAADGGRSDYAFGDTVSSFAPVKIDRVLHDKDTITLGGMHLLMLHHPGHTKGSCSFLFDVKDDKRSYRVLIANMPSIVTNKPFNNIAAYPNISQDYAYTLKAMKSLTFDLWLSSHASQFDLHRKHQPGNKYNPAAFIDRKGYDTALKGLEQQYLKKISEQ
ncbi:subclass B3 metallo-beta-lactamase [Paraflavitalea pollutisoli]|uniref:subclass B3 metallo-beta-lactamase n=1 Tax=Paraflavitalea pollutisoli TaxID=3034143 RepID=UPI0023EA907A|nr:subclass B3 metallo-beta-lactamase [Paraflavitalea sp. H1-2-19X]